MKIIGACIVNNAGEYLAATLDGIANRIGDIDAFVIFDGAWEHSGFPNPFSIDNTEEIVASFAKKQFRRDVLFVRNQNNGYWRNPSEKRNTMFQYIDEMYGDDEYFIFWFDDDEEVRFTDGREITWLKDSLKENPEIPRAIQTYAHNSTIPMLTIRLIPRGYHFHTERAMNLHTNNHDAEFEWTPKQEISQMAFIENTTLFIINKWNLKSESELKRKYKYAGYETELYKTREPCTFGSLPS